MADSVQPKPESGEPRSDKDAFGGSQGGDVPSMQGNRGVSKQSTTKSPVDRQVRLKSLPDKRVIIHWLQRCAEGKIKIHGGTLSSSIGPMNIPPQTYRMACQPERTNVNPVSNGFDVVPFPHSDDPRAVTCPKCLETEECRKALEELA